MHNEYISRIVVHERCCGRVVVVVVVRVVVVVVVVAAAVAAAVVALRFNLNDADDHLIALVA
jgi:hypothetical protein